MGKKDTYTVKVTDYPHQEVKQENGKMVLTETTTKRTIEMPVMEEFVDVKLPRRAKFDNGAFITVFQKALANIAMFSKLSKEEYRMLVFLMGTCGVANSVCIDLVQLSEKLSMPKSNVSRALKGLVERNIVIRKDGYRYGKAPLPFELHLNFDQINYNVAYNGKTKIYSKTKETHPKLMKDDGTTPLLEASEDDSQMSIPFIDEDQAEHSVE